MQYEQLDDIYSGQKQYTFKDLVLLGGIAGVLAVLTRDAWSLFSKLVGLAKFEIWQRSADLFIEGKDIKDFHWECGWDFGRRDIWSNIRNHFCLFNKAYQL